MQIWQQPEKPLKFQISKNKFQSTRVIIYTMIALTLRNLRLGQAVT
jgi:hypothetical protein